MGQSTSVNSDAINALKRHAESAMNGCGIIPGLGTDGIDQVNGENTTVSNGGQMSLKHTICQI